MPIWIVSKEESPLELKQFLARKIPLAPPAYLRQLIRKGKVRNSAGLLAETAVVTPGEAIQLSESNKVLELLKASSKLINGLNILFESREILVVEKPSGLAIHSSKGHEKHNLTDLLREHYGHRNVRFQIAPIQRLDLETSGPVLFGKGKKSCAELGKLFMRREVRKIYLALVEGKIQGCGTLLTEISAKGKIKSAETDYRALGGNAAATLLEIELRSGRRHQIRRQLAEIGHPLFGDTRYRGPMPQQLKRLFLHCRTLAFTDPFSGRAVQIDSPLPDDLNDFLAHIFGHG